MSKFHSKIFYSLARFAAATLCWSCSPPGLPSEPWVTRGWGQWAGGPEDGAYAHFKPTPKPSPFLWKTSLSQTPGTARLGLKRRRRKGRPSFEKSLHRVEWGPNMAGGRGMSSLWVHIVGGTHTTQLPPGLPTWWPTNGSTRAAPTPGPSLAALAGMYSPHCQAAWWMASRVEANSEGFIFPMPQPSPLNHCSCGQQPRQAAPSVWLPASRACRVKPGIVWGTLLCTSLSAASPSLPGWAFCRSSEVWGATLEPKATSNLVLD